MNPDLEVNDIIGRPGLERLLYRRISPMTFRRYRKRESYLENTIPRGLEKYVLFLDGITVGQVEFARA